MSLAMEYVLYYSFPILHCIDKQVFKQYFVYIWQNTHVQQNSHVQLESVYSSKFRFITFLHLVLFFCISGLDSTKHSGFYLHVNSQVLKCKARHISNRFALLSP